MLTMRQGFKQDNKTKKDYDSNVEKERNKVGRYDIRPRQQRAAY